MSWLFGKKKQKESPPQLEEDQFTESTSTNGFTYITRNDGGPATDPGPLYPSVPPDYPIVPGDYPTGATGFPVKDTGLPSFDSYLSGVPFKLCKRLETTLNSDLEIDRLRINEVLGYIERIDGQNFDYDFSLEKSVINEMSSNDQ